MSSIDPKNPYDMLKVAVEFLKNYKNEDKELDRRTKISSFLDEAEALSTQEQPAPITTEIVTEVQGKRLFPVENWDYQAKKPEFHVFGVQMLENRKLAGTALYASMPRARFINDMLNQEYARLKSEIYEAKIMPYPVY